MIGARESMSIDLRCGDCLEVMGEIEPGSIDLILCDLPYGTTACKWDTVIPFEPLWAHYKRILKPRGAVVLTASQPFTSMLVMSNLKWFRYEVIWDSVTVTGHLNAKHRPMKAHESTLLFAVGKTTFNPQLVERTEAEMKRLSVKGFRDRPSSGNAYGSTRGHQFGPRESRRFKAPRSIIRINGLSGRHVERGLHPTQKPVALMEYLIKTYSNEGDTVLDNCMGSGTTGAACLNTDRNFIGIENNAPYFETASRRIHDQAASAPLFAS